MIAFFGSLSLGETVLIVVIAILVFGKRLPQVAGQLTGQIVRARRALSDLRRETGLDEELRQARDAVHEAVDDLAREPEPPRRKLERPERPEPPMRAERPAPAPADADADADADAEDPPAGRTD